MLALNFLVLLLEVIDFPNQYFGNGFNSLHAGYFFMIFVLC